MTTETQTEVLETKEVVETTEQETKEVVEKPKRGPKAKSAEPTVVTGDVNLKTAKIQEPETRGVKVFKLNEHTTYFLHFISHHLIYYII